MQWRINLGHFILAKLITFSTLPISALGDGEEAFAKRKLIDEAASKLHDFFVSLEMILSKPRSVQEREDH